MQLVLSILSEEAKVMAICSSCQQHRQNIVKAVRGGDLKKAVAVSVDAIKALGENAGRKAIKPKGKK